MRVSFCYTLTISYCFAGLGLVFPWTMYFLSSKQEPGFFGRSKWFLLCLVFLGLFLRGYHYGRNPSVWHDEAALIVNVLGKDFQELLGPLDLAEAAPPLFLWIERTAVLVLGDNTYALRLAPFLASLAALLLLAFLAWRTLGPSAFLWAVLLFACSDRLLWHACEAKPYSFDVLAAVLLPAVFAATQAWNLPRRLFVFTILSPFVIFLAYPGCFLCGGVLLAFGPAVWRDKRWQTWLSYLALSAAVASAFFLLLIGPIHAQRCEAMLHCWQNDFPDWQRPWTVPGWSLWSTMEVVSYCCRPAGEGLVVFALVGAVHLWRIGRRRWLVLLMSPTFLAELASLLRAYPYGGSRVLVFAAPAIVLLSAEGVASAWHCFQARSRPALAAMALFLCLPLGLALLRVVIPWQRADCHAAAEYVLCHRLSGDMVAARNWESLYYFRKLGSGFATLDPGNPLPSKRLWVVLTGNTEAERQLEQGHGLAKQWQVLQQREFVRATVLLVQVK